MARMQLFFPVRDLSGNQIAGARVYLFAAGTAAVTDPPTGTAITGSIFTTRTGVTTTTSPLTSDASGIAQVWLETAQALDIVTTDATNTAVYAGTARKFDFAPFLKVFDTSGDVEAHEADPAGAHAASAVAFTPTGTVAATDVQAAIAEVASEAGSGNAKLAVANVFTEPNTFTDPVAIDFDPLNDGGVAHLAGRGYGDHAEGFAFVATRSRGTQASPTTPLEDDFILSLGSTTYDDGQYRSTATIRYAVDAGTPGATVPSRIEFWTSNSDDMLQRLQIDSSGKVWFISNPDVTPLLDTNLYRDSADHLKTDDSLTVTGTAGNVALENHTNVFTRGQTIALGTDEIALNITVAGAVANGLLVNYQDGSILSQAAAVNGTGVFNVFGETGAASFNFYGYGNSTAGPLFTFAKHRGEQGAVADVLSGDALGAVIAQGNFTVPRTAAQIAFVADAAPASSRVPGRIGFWTQGTAGSLTERLRIDSAGDFTVSEGGDFILGTTTGTKLGTATTQKIGFYNATPVVQPAAVSDATDAGSAITQLNLALARLRTLGLIAT